MVSGLEAIQEEPTFVSMVFVTFFFRTESSQSFSGEGSGLRVITYSRSQLCDGGGVHVQTQVCLIPIPWLLPYTTRGQL